MSAGKLMSAAGAAIMAPMLGAVKGAADFEFSMDAVNAALGGMDTKTMAQLSNQALELGANSKFSATEVAGVQEQLAKSGLVAQDLLGPDGLSGATKAVLDLAAATGEDLPTAAMSAAGAMNMFGLDGSQAADVADIYTAALNNSSASLPQLNAGIAALGPTIANLDRNLGNGEAALRETAGAVGYFNSQGIKAADVGVSVNGMITDLARQSGPAYEEMTRLGISAFNLDGSMKTLPDLFDELQDKMAGMTDQQRIASTAQLVGREAADVFSQAIKKGGQPLRDYMELMDQEGLAAKQAAIRQDNLTGAVEQLGGALNGLAIQMGTPLLDPLKEGAKKLAGLTKALTDAPPEVQELVAQFGLLSGGLLSFGGIAALGTGQVLKLAEQFSKAGLSLPKFAAGLGLIGLAIGAGLLAYDTNFLGFADKVNGAMENAGKAVEGFGQRFDKVFNEDKAAGLNDVAAGLDAFGRAVKHATDGAVDITNLTNKLSRAAQDFGDTWERNMAAGEGLLTSFFDAAESAARAAGADDLADQLNRLAQASRVFGDTWERNMAAGESLLTSFFDAAESAARAAGMKDLADMFNNLAQGARQLDSTFNAMKDAGFNDVAAGLMGIGDAIDSILGTDISPFFFEAGKAAQAFGNEWEEARAAGLDPFTSALLATRDALGQISGVDLGPMFDNFGGAIQSGLEGVGAFKDALLAGDWDTAWDGLTGGLADFGVKMGDIDLGGKLQGVSDQLGGWFQDVSDMLLGTDAQFAPGATQTTGLIQKLADTLGQGFQELPQKIGDAIQAIDNPLQDVQDWFGDSVSRLKQDLIGEEQTFGLGETIAQGAIPQLADDLVSGFKNLPQTIGDAISAFDNPLQGVQDWIGDSAEALKNDLLRDQQTVGLGETIQQGVIPQLADDLVAGFRAFPQTIGDAISAIDNPFQSVTDWLSQGVSQLKQSLVGEQQTFGLGETLSQGVLPDLVDSIGNTLQELPQQVTQKLGDAQTFFQPIGEWLQEGLQQAGQTLFGGTTAGGPGGLGGGPMGGDAISGAIPELAQNIGDALQKLPELVTTGLGDAQTFFQPVTEWLGEGLTIKGDQLSQLKASALDLGVQAMGTITQSMNEGVEQAGKGATFTGPTGGTAAASPIAQNIDDWFLAANAAIDKAAEVSPEFSEASFKLGQATGHELTQKLGEGLSAQAKADGATPGHPPQNILDAIHLYTVGIGDAVHDDWTSQFAFMADDIRSFDNPMEPMNDAFQGWLHGSRRELLGGLDVAGGPGEREIKGMIPQFAEDIIGGFAKLPAMVGKKLESIGNPLQGVSEAMQGWLQDTSRDIFGGFDTMAGPGEREIQGALPKFAEDLATNFVGGFEKLPDMVGQKLKSIPNPFEGVQSWLQEGMSQVSQFFQGKGPTGPGGLGGGPMGGVETSGIGQMFDGMLQGIADAIPDPGDVGTFLKEKGEGFMQAVGNNILGPLGQLIFPSSDAKASQEAATDMGKTMGTNIANAMQDPAFADSLEKAVATLPPNTFQKSGQAILGALDMGLQSAMRSTPLDAQGKAIEGALSGGEQMVNTITDGLTAALDPKTIKPEVFIPAASGLLGGLNTALGQVMMSQGPDSPEAPAGTSPLGQNMGDALTQTLATGLAAGITAAKPETFIPVTTALGTKLSEAMQVAQQASDTFTGPTGGVAAPQQMTGFGQLMAEGMATGLASGITAAKPETFIPVTNALGTQLSAAMQLAQTQAPSGPGGNLGPGGMTGTGEGVVTGFGQLMAQGMATGLATGITAAKPEIFTPVTNALGTQLSAAMQLAGATAPSGPGGNLGPGGMTGTGEGIVGGFGQLMTQGMATGLAAGITAADPGVFVPVTNALGTQLGAAMQQASGQAVDVVGGPAGGVGTPQIAGLGTGMVEGLATGLTSQITAADPAVFAPVGGALQAQLGTALQTAQQSTQQPGPTGVPIAAPGAGQDMVTGLATGLTEQIAAAPEETFAPVGQAVQSQISTALQTAAEGATFTGPTGGAGAGTDIGQQLGESVSLMMQSGVEQADFTDVGTGISTKMGEALQTATADMGDVGTQMGDSISQMLNSAVEGADFSSVGTTIGEKLTEAITKAIETAKQGISEAMQGISEAMTTAIEDISTTISTAVSDVEAAVNDLAAAVAGATANVTSAVATMQSAVETAASSMESAATSATTAMTDMGTAATTAGAAVAAAMASIAASFASAASAATAAAATIVAALHTITAAAGEAAGAVAGVGAPGGGGGTAPAPSGGGGGAVPMSLEVGATDIGTATTQGFSDGVVNNQSAVDDAMNSLSTMAIASLEDAVGAASPAKKFMPVGASVSQGFLKGMLDDAKSRLASAIGKMAGAVKSAMGKIGSAMQSGMDRAHSMVQTAMGRTQKEAAAGGTEAGKAASGGMAEGIDSESKQAEQAAERLWKKALKKLIKGKGEARFLGKEFAREFWLGILDEAGKLDTSSALDSLEGLADAAKKFGESMRIVQDITAKAVDVAENAIEAVRAKIAGLKTQFDLVSAWIASLQSELASVTAELASMDAAAASAAAAAADAEAERAGQARIDAAQALLDAQKAITAELEKQLGIEFQAAHQAHIVAAQNPNDPGAQADFQTKLATAQQTNAGIAQSKAQEDTLAKMLAAVQEEVKAESAARAAARAAEAAAAEAARRADLEARKAALQAELEEAQRIAAAIAKAQHDAQVEYTNTVIEESTKRIAQLQKELKHDRGDPEALANDRAQIALEKQRVELANQLAEALAKQAAGGSPEEMAAVNAQIDYLNKALLALDDVDVGAMLTEIVSKLGGVATTMDGAATSMATAAKSLGSMDVAAPVADTAKAVDSVGTAAGKATTPVRDMGTAYNDVMKKMADDGFAFQAKFQEMVAANQKTAETGGAAIGDALSTQITGKISGGAAALQKTMMDGLTGAIDPATETAKEGGEAIAKTFGQQMQEKMGTQLSDVHKTLLDSPPNGLNPMISDATTAAEKGGTDIGHGLGTEMKQGLADKADPFKDKVFHTYDDPIQKGITDAGNGGNNIGDSMGRGMNQGLSNWAHTIAENVRGIVGNALNAGHNAAGSSRVSSKMRDLGDSMGLGLIYGMNDRKREANDASAALVHIPRINPTSDGGVSGARGAGGTTNTTTIHIEHLELPDVHDPEDFMRVIEQYARSSGVSSGRS
jgi:TP901 family phage tail tape measure protein